MQVRYCPAQLEKCPTCNGTGKEYDGHNGCSYGDPYTCTSCLGKGMAYRDLQLSERIRRIEKHLGLLDEIGI